MFINDPPKPRTRKELKVNLPAHQHSRLRELQAASGQEAPALVAEALGLYFSRLNGSAGAPAPDDGRDRASTGRLRTSAYPLR